MELCVLSGQNNLINSFNIQYCKILLLVLMLLTIILSMAELTVPIEGIYSKIVFNKWSIYDMLLFSKERPIFNR